MGLLGSDIIHIQFCPNGCKRDLVDSSIVLKEGPLRICSECGQLVSRCTKDVYLKSNNEWDTEEGTWPSQQDIKRLMKRRRRDLRYVSKILSKRLSEIRLLDVGCSNGAFVWIANKLGVDAEGIDVSVNAVKNGLERGLKIHQGCLDDIGFKDNYFDVITLYEVIEHVDKPINLLRECNRIIKPGGMLVIGTGNTNSWTKHFMGNKWDFFDMHQHGGHINFYSTKSLYILADHSGFIVKKIRTSSVNFIDQGNCSYLQYRIAKCFSELLNYPARIFGKGHQMEAYLVSKEVAAS